MGSFYQKKKKKHIPFRHSIFEKASEWLTLQPSNDLHRKVDHLCMKFESPFSQAALKVLYIYFPPKPLHCSSSHSVPIPLPWFGDGFQWPGSITMSPSNILSICFNYQHEGWSSTHTITSNPFRMNYNTTPEKGIPETFVALSTDFAWCTVKPQATCI